MTRPVKYAAGIVMGFVVVIIGLLALSGFGSNETSPPVGQGESQLVHADSHVPGEKGASDVTFVEFLDFECEACGAFYPTMERIRKEYGDEITVAIRYFPIPSHTNAQIAAQAVEAAANQGALEEMYKRMYETQVEWGESQDSKEALFVKFARDLGLDMGQFEKDLNAPETVERVKSDQEAGIALGVQGTPTIFFNGEKLRGMPTYEDLRSRIDAALAQ